MPDLIDIGRNFRIVSPDVQGSADGHIDLIIAKGAFGSGEHETTASCLEILEDLPELEGCSLLDLGSGTGVLAIGALKLGAAEAVCIDISPDAVKTCEQNCERNDVNNRVRHVTGTLASLSGEQFDLVLANIYGDLLLDLAADLVKVVRQGGRLLLSGMLWEYNFDVRQTYQQLGCEMIQNRMLDEFSTVLLKRN